MNKDQVKGRVEQVKGKIKEAAGKVTDNNRLKTEGKVDQAAGIAAPGIVKTAVIAEAGFIYGLPIVMNYAVMYEYAIDR